MRGIRFVLSIKDLPTESLLFSNLELYFMQAPGQQLKEEEEMSGFQTSGIHLL